MTAKAKIISGIFTWVSTSTGNIVKRTVGATHFPSKTSDVENKLLQDPGETRPIAKVVGQTYAFLIDDTYQIWICTTAGDSAGSLPTFPEDAAVDDTVADGDIVWTCVGYMPEVPGKRFSIWYNDEGQIHRSISSGEAYVENTISNEARVTKYYKNDLLHNTVGAAVNVFNDENTVIEEEFWVNGRKFNTDHVYFFFDLFNNGGIAPYLGFVGSNPMTTEADLELYVATYEDLVP